MATDAQLRANARYEKRNVRQVSLKFYPAERELYEWVRSQPNSSGYVKALIEADMRNKTGSGTR